MPASPPDAKVFNAEYAYLMISGDSATQRPFMQSVHPCVARGSPWKMHPFWSTPDQLKEMFWLCATASVAVPMLEANQFLTVQDCEQPPITVTHSFTYLAALKKTRRETIEEKPTQRGRSIGQQGRRALGPDQYNATTTTTNNLTTNCPRTFFLKSHTFHIQQVSFS